MLTGTVVPLPHPPILKAWLLVCLGSFDGSFVLHSFSSTGKLWDWHAWILPTIMGRMDHGTGFDVKFG